MYQFLAKIIIIIATGYALSPIDLIPDFIPILGYLDDLLILPLLVKKAGVSESDTPAFFSSLFVLLSTQQRTFLFLLVFDPELIRI